MAVAVKAMIGVLGKFFLSNPSCWYSVLKSCPHSAVIVCAKITPILLLFAAANESLPTICEGNKHTRDTMGLVDSNERKRTVSMKRGQEAHAIYG